MIHRRQFITASSMTVLAALAGCTDVLSGGNDSETTGGENATVKTTSQVSMVDSQFQPRNIHIDTETTVTWTNEDSSDHTVTSASDNWSIDETVPGGESVEHTFAKSGVYDVYCTIHGKSDLSGMGMKVGVGDATIDSPLGEGGGDGGEGGDGGDDDGGYY